MAPRNNKQNQKQFDEARLQRMAEPISVTVNKVVAGKRTPISVPPGPGEQVSGQGYDKDMVRQLADFLAKEWTGGGLYEIAATDSQGEQMGWEAYFHPEQFPPRQPPGSENATPSAPAAQASSGYSAAGPNYLSRVASTYGQQHSHQQQGSPFVPPGGLAAAPYGAPAYGPQWSSPPMTFGGGRYAPAPSPFTYGSSYGGYQSGGSQDAGAQREREERLKLESRIEQERIQSQHQKEMSDLQNEIRRLQDSINKRPADEESAALKSAQQKIEALEQQNSQQQMLHQMQQMQQQTNELIRSVQESTQKQIDEMRRQQEAAAKKDGPSDMMMMMQMQQQMQQAQIQSQRDLAQMQMQAHQESQKNQLSPMQIIDVVNKNNQNQHQLAEAYGQAWNLMAQGVETVLNAQGPQAHPALMMIGQAAEGALGMGQRYLEMKEKQSQSAAQTEAYKAQLEAQAKVQSAHAYAQAGQLSEGGGESDEEGPSEEELQSTENALFGEAYPSVMNLRKAIDEDKIDSDKTAMAIFQAIEYFANSGKDLPKVFALYQEERFGDFIDALIPNAHHTFREEVASKVHRGVNELKRRAGVAVQNQAAEETANENDEAQSA